MQGYGHRFSWDVEEFSIGLGQRFSGGIDEVHILDAALDLLYRLSNSNTRKLIGSLSIRLLHAENPLGWWECRA